jgi:hypothetical protein
MRNFREKPQFGQPKMLLDDYGIANEVLDNSPDASMPIER